MKYTTVYMWDKDETVYNTNEGKIAKEVAVQFISRKVGWPTKGDLREEVKILLRLSDEIDNSYQIVKNLCKQIDLTQEDAMERITHIGESICSENVNWGRIAITYAYAGKLVEQCRLAGDDKLIESITKWLSWNIAKKSTWIRLDGYGWEGFIKQYINPIPDSPDNSWFRGILTTTLTLGTLAAAMYIKNK